ncbi:hypothetical protein SCLCIDRAFT_555183 [Scleroderma citrinum Foug A]|uniref:Uncharacterized protein n=1 Tax=Scleroderma citrinum Foug A TaxID=1036808 RepID=A0A0C3D8K6_9AGAM|nr:hypothetical protein SCLCIDRAFT_555183 [Scleroderma citrinum Foug A]
MNFRFVCRCRPKNDYVNHWNIQRRIYDFPLEETDQVATGLGTSLKNRFLVNGAIIDLGEVTSISVKLSLSGSFSSRFEKQGNGPHFSTKLYCKGNSDHATSLEGLRKRPLIRDTMPADVDECSNCIGATTGGVLTSRTSPLTSLGSANCEELVLLD